MKCQFCNKSFNNKGSLKSHERFCLLNPEVQKPICKYCNKEFDNTSKKYQHEYRCTKNPKNIHENTYIKNELLYCQYCNKECHNLNSLRQHECRCVQNPNKRDNDKLGKYSTQYNKGQTKETNPLIAKQANTIRTRILNDEIDFSSRVRTKYKFGTYKTIHCDSSWELAFILYLLDNNIPFIRNTSHFSYEYNGHLHEYYPDFIVDNIYYEIKGYYDEKSKIKIEQFSKENELIVLDPKTIQPYLEYARSTYGKNFYRMYDRNYPSWMDLEENDNDISNSYLN